MRDPTFSFARPRPKGAPGEPIELSEHGDMEAELGLPISRSDPRKGPADRMTSREFLVWLCASHTSLERNILVELFVRSLRRAADGKAALFFKTAGPRALRVDLRMGRIAPAKLKLLTRHARTRTLQVHMIEHAITDVQGAACYVDSEIIGVFAAYDVVVLEL